MAGEESKKPICLLRSCANNISDDLTRRCSLGIRSTPGSPCPEYRPARELSANKLPLWYEGEGKAAKPACGLRSCAHHARENFTGRCVLGLNHRSGPCSEYRPKERARKIPKWYFPEKDSGR